MRARGIKNSVAALRASTTIMQASKLILIILFVYYFSIVNLLPRNIFLSFIYSSAIRMYHEQKQFVAQRKAALLFQNSMI